MFLQVPLACNSYFIICTFSVILIGHKAFGITSIKLIILYCLTFQNSESAWENRKFHVKWGKTGSDAMREGLGLHTRSHTVHYFLSCNHIVFRFTWSLSIGKKYIMFISPVCFIVYDDDPMISALSLTLIFPSLLLSLSKYYLILWDCIDFYKYCSML